MFENTSFAGSSSTLGTAMSYIDGISELVVWPLLMRATDRETVRMTRPLKWFILEGLSVVNFCYPGQDDERALTAGRGGNWLSYFHCTYMP